MAQFVHNLTEKTPALVNTAVTYSKSRLATFWHYTKVELVPPNPAKIPTAIQSLKKIANSAQTGSFKELTAKEAVLNGLVATEVWMWFYIRDHRQAWHRALRCLKTNVQHQIIFDLLFVWFWTMSVEIVI